MKYKQTTTKTGLKNLKQRYKQLFGVSVSFLYILYCFFDLLIMFIDSTTKITPPLSCKCDVGEFFRTNAYGAQMTVITLSFGPNKYFFNF